MIDLTQDVKDYIKATLTELTNLKTAKIEHELEALWQHIRALEVELERLNNLID